MVLLSRNKKAFKSVSFFFSVSLLAALLFLVISYQFENENLLEFSIIFKFISLFFLIISTLFGFTIGQIIVRLFRDKSHKHLEEEIITQKSNISLQTPLDNHQTPIGNEKEQISNSETLYASKRNIEQNKQSEIVCNHCKKEIFNPYKCNVCLSYYCSDHFLIGDHNCN